LIWQKNWLDRPSILQTEIHNVLPFSLRCYPQELCQSPHGRKTTYQEQWSRRN
jgi:hypothetical protein